MAEIVGTVAAAIQLTETVWKLKELCSNIRNAPGDLVDLVEEISALANVLAELKQHHAVQHQTVVDQNAWNRCHKLLQASIVATREVTSELESTLKVHRLTRHIRVYLKRDELKRCSDRMERAKTTMTAAEQSYSFALLTQQNALLLKEIRSIAMDQQAIKQIVATSPTTQSTHQTSGIHDANAGLLITSGTAVSAPYYRQTIRSRQSYCYNVRLPQWIYRRGLKILIERSSSSWGATFQTVNRLPSDAEVFRYARQGQWNDIQALLDAGRASLFDEDANGKNLLDMAVQYLDYRGCEFLLRCAKFHSGAWRLEYDSIQIFANIVYNVSRIDDTETTRMGLSAACRVLVATLPTVREMTCDDFVPLWHRMHMQVLPYECAQLIANETYLSHEDMDILQRVEYAMHTRSPDAQTVLALLGHNMTLRKAFELLETSGSNTSHRTLFSSIAKMTGELYHSGNTESNRMRMWMDMLAEVVSFEIAKAAMMPFFSGLWPFLMGRSSRQGLGSNSFVTSSQVWTDETKVWIRILRDMGVNLELYGRAESACFGTDERHSLDEAILREGGCDWYGGKVGRDFKIGYMTYGPEIDDWAVWIVPRSGTHYEMAAAFWNFVENPELFGVPGTFLEASEDEGRFSCSFGSWAQAPCM